MLYRLNVLPIVTQLSSGPGKTVWLHFFIASLAYEHLLGDEVNVFYLQKVRSFFSLVTICKARSLSVSDISHLTSGISTYRSAFSILCAWSFFANISVELSQAYFIFRPTSNSSNGMFYHSLITQGFAILSGLKMNSSYKVDVAVGVPTSKLLWPVIQPIQSMKLSTQDTSEFELFHVRFFSFTV